MKDDIIAALLLHPECDECLSLIARVFPGKTARELMHSHEASTVCTKLDAEMKGIAKLYTTSSDKPSDSNAIPPIASQYLEGIELKLAESTEDKSNSDTAMSHTVPSLGAATTKLHYHPLSAKSPAGAGSRPPSTKSRKSSANNKDTVGTAKLVEEIEQGEEEGSSQPCKLILSLIDSSFRFCQQEYYVV